MPDIFLSYSRQDLPIAGKMAAALLAAGHNVWWDQALKSGEVYDQVTETALRQARVVVVLWSKSAVASDWVRSEATVAMQRGTLMPVMIEACQRPVMFELRQSADLIGWKGNAKDPRLVAFLADLARQLDEPAGATKLAAKVMAARTGPSRRDLFGGVAGVGLLAVGGFGAWKLWSGNTGGDGTASVAVLPFANLSGDPAQAFFSDGIAEELRNAMSQIRGIKVIGRVSSEQFRDASDLSVVAQKLGVAHILTGSVRRSPTTIRIGAQLIDGKNGVESWSQSYDQPVGDVLAVQSRIASSVVAALSPRLGKAAGMVVVGGTSNQQAQVLFLKAGDLRQAALTEANTRQRLALLDAAVALDPRYAEAVAGRSQALTRLSLFAKSAADYESTGREAMAAARRAVAIAPRSGYARSVLASRLSNALETRAALAEAGRAWALAPGDWRVASNYGAVVAAIDPARAVDIARANVALDPLNVAALGEYAYALKDARRYKEAADIGQQAMTMSNGSKGWGGRFLALLGLGRYDEARALFPNMVFDWRILTYTAILEARVGNRAASDAALAGLRKIDVGTVHYQFARIHAQRGETTAALDAIEAAYRSKDSGLTSIAIDFLLDPLRKEPRFKAVQDKIIPPDLFVPTNRR